MSPFTIPRRWMRHPVDLPIFVTVIKDNNTVRVPGRVSEISEGGMALYAGVHVVPGDMLTVEFQTPGRTQIEAVVRSKAGCCFGVEFLAPLSEENRRGTPRMPVMSPNSSRSQAELGVLLRRKELEIQRLRNEINVLHALTRRKS